MQKKFIAVILVIATMFCLATFCSAETQKDISIYVNGNYVFSEVPPQIIDGSTLVPLRVIFEALGATVEWNNDTKTVSSTLGDTSIKLTIGENKLYKNDKSIELNVPAQIIDGRTMVPVRAISESFGYFVDWHKEIRAVSIKETKRVDLIPYYNLDGQRVTIEKALSLEYDLLGWSEDINKIKSYVTMYSADGRTMNVVKSQVEDYKAVGWYTEPVVLMYASDGRTLYVEESRVEAHKQVGWGTEPFVLMYAADGRTMYVEQSKVEANKLVGWSTEKPKIYPTNVYTTGYLELNVGGTSQLSCSFAPVTTTETAVTWTSSNPAVAQVRYDGKVTGAKAGNAKITAQTSNGLTASCNVVVKDMKYDSSKTGSITGLVTYQYNKIIGTKPDVDAKVLLIQANHQPSESDDFTMLIFSSPSLNPDNLVYSTRVDGMGNFYFDYIPAGKYYMLVLSSNTNQSPSTSSSNISKARSYLRGKISEEGLHSLEVNINVNSFDIVEVQVRENQTFRYSKDWGYTYI